MSDDNLKLKNEGLWRRYVHGTEMMMHVYSDGSVKYAREEGTWVWEAYIAERPDRPNSTVLHLVAAGDGKETRAHRRQRRGCDTIRKSGAAGIGSMTHSTTSVERLGSMWYTDLQATIDTWNSIEYNSARKWSSVVSRRQKCMAYAETTEERVGRKSECD
jgi:hypothetical protein